MSRREIIDKTQVRNLLQIINQGLLELQENNDKELPQGMNELNTELQHIIFTFAQENMIELDYILGNDRKKNSKENNSNKRFEV